MKTRFLFLLLFSLTKSHTAFSQGVYHTAVLGGPENVEFSTESEWSALDKLQLVEGGIVGKSHPSLAECLRILFGKYKIQWAGEEYRDSSGDVVAIRSHTGHYHKILPKNADQIMKSYLQKNQEYQDITIFQYGELDFLNYFGSIEYEPSKVRHHFNAIPMHLQGLVLNASA